MHAQKLEIHQKNLFIRKMSKIGKRKKELLERKKVEKKAK